MKRKYPYLGSCGRYKRSPGSKCKFCDDRAIGYIEVQFWCFRGDDEKYQVCANHLDKAKENLNRLMKMVKHGVTEEDLAMDIERGNK